MVKIKKVYIILEDGKPCTFERYPNIIMIHCYTSERKAKTAMGLFGLLPQYHTILPVELYPKKYHPMEIRDSMEVRAEMRLQDSKVKSEGHWQG